MLFFSFMILKFQLFDVSCFLMHMPILFISDWLNFSSLFFFFFFLNMYLWKILLREVFMLTLMPFEMNITAKGGMKLNQYFHYVQKCENVFNELAKNHILYCQNIQQEQVLHSENRFSLLIHLLLFTSFRLCCSWFMKRRKFHFCSFFYLGKKKRFLVPRICS